MFLLHSPETELNEYAVQLYVEKKGISNSIARDIHFNVF